MIFGEALWIMEMNYSTFPHLYLEKEFFIMLTFTIYWNAKSFTKYEHILEDRYLMHDGYIQFVQSNGVELIIPWLTINRIEVVAED